MGLVRAGPGPGPSFRAARHQDRPVPRNGCSGGGRGARAARGRGEPGLASPPAHRRPTPDRSRMPDGGPQSADDDVVQANDSATSPPAPHRRPTPSRVGRGAGSASGQAPGRRGVEGSQGCRSSSRRLVPTPARERRRRRGRGGAGGARGRHPGSGLGAHAGMWIGEGAVVGGGEGLGRTFKTTWQGLPPPSLLRSHPPPWPHSFHPCCPGRFSFSEQRLEISFAMHAGTPAVRCASSASRRARRNACKR